MQILSTGPPAELRTGEPYSGEMAAERPRPKTSPGLIILGAVFFGVLGYVLHDVAANSRWGRSSGPLTEKFDYNQDGQPDHFFTFHDGYMERGTADRNGDGKIDEWTFHGSNGICLRVELDDDFDGRVDSWFAYKNGVIATSKRDLDFDGHSDWNGLYEDGILYEGEMTPNESRQVIRREIYRHGVFREEWVDEDHDGAFDVKFLYDPFGNRSERLPPR